MNPGAAGYCFEDLGSEFDVRLLPRALFVFDTACEGCLGRVIPGLLPYGSTEAYNQQPLF